MKKAIVLLMIVSIILSSGLTNTYAETAIKVSVNGRILTLDVNPTVIEGRTLVPLRAIFEALGAQIEWDNDTKTVTGIKGDKTIILQIGNKKAKVNGVIKELEVAGIAVNNRTLVPTRFIAESLGAKVDWDGKNRIVVITSNENKVESSFNAKDIYDKILIKNIAIDAEKEVVTLKNASNKDVNLTGWKLTSTATGKTFNFHQGYVLKAGESVEIYSGTKLTPSENGALYWDKESVWETVEASLVDNSNNLVSDYPNSLMIDFYNYLDEISKLAALENKVVREYASVTGENYIDDKTLYSKLTEEIIPTYKEFTTGLQKIHPEAGEIQKLHNIYLEGSNLNSLAFATIIEAIEKGSHKIALDANDKLSKAAILIKQWVDQILEVDTFYKNL